jgi:hypothetical protein
MVPEGLFGVKRKSIANLHDQLLGVAGVLQTSSSVQSLVYGRATKVPQYALTAFPTLVLVPSTKSCYEFPYRSGQLKVILPVNTIFHIISLFMEAITYTY